MIVSHHIVIQGIDDGYFFVLAKLDLRLTLFYLCNEVVQTCKRKHAIVFKDAFKEVLKDAALLVRLVRTFFLFEHILNFLKFIELILVFLSQFAILDCRLLCYFSYSKSDLARLV